MKGTVVTGAHGHTARSHFEHQALLLYSFLYCFCFMFFPCSSGVPMVPDFQAMLDLDVLPGTTEFPSMLKVLLCFVPLK